MSPTMSKMPMPEGGGVNFPTAMKLKDEINKGMNTWLESDDLQLIELDAVYADPANRGGAPLSIPYMYSGWFLGPVYKTSRFTGL